MKKNLFLSSLIALLVAGGFFVTGSYVQAIVEESTLISFVDPTPADGDMISNSAPTFAIETEENLSEATISFKLLNGDLEEGNMGYFESDGYYWEIDSAVSKEGVYSAKSSSYFDGSGYYNYSSLKRRVVLDSDSGLSFWWNVSTEEATDEFLFYINGVIQDTLVGNQEWVEMSYDLSAGTYDLVWKYKKNVTGVVGRDFARIDEVRIHPYVMEIGSDGMSAAYNAANLSEGLHKYFVSVKDSDDNESVGSLRSISIDTVKPSGYVSITPYYQNKEVIGDTYISVTLNDDNSYVKDVCLWLGDEEENLLPLGFEECKDLSQKTIYSWPYAPDFGFEVLDTTLIEDGTYNLYAIATDNAGNENILSADFNINNYSEGSVNNPSLISTCAELQAMNDNLHWSYKLINDLDCSETKNWNSGKGFLGIGNSGNSFSGVLDGQNYHVYNIYQNIPEENSGIFHSTSGSIKNVNFRNVDIVCNSTYCGGFSQLNWGTIEKSSITGSLQCSGKCGGFASQQSGTISQCWGDMKIGNSGYSGGFGGQFYGGTVSNSYFKGQITADNGGGIVGLNEGTLTNTYSNAKINDSGYNGALIGWQYSGNQVGSYWNKEISGLELMCGTNGTNCLNENGLTDAQMKDSTSFIGWDFDTIWAIDPEKNDGYPYLRWQTSFTSKDTDAPIITLNGPALVELNVGDSYVDQGATALDNTDGNISAKIMVINNVDASIVGTYTITYNVSDEAGNAANQVSRTVVVKVAPKSSGGGSVYFNNDRETTFQSYNPTSGILIIGQENDPEEVVEVLGVEEEFIELSEAELVVESGREKSKLINHVSRLEDTASENITRSLYAKVLTLSGIVLSAQEEMAVVNFIHYGTQSTLRHGTGERAGVVNSYKSAFGKLPKTVADWEDAIRIANGRWPSQISLVAEEQAEAKFKKIYLRDANRANRHDDAAVVIIAYGLRPTNRNLASEQAAIRIFKAIFSQNPESAIDWDAVRAIAYSGAVR